MKKKLLLGAAILTAAADAVLMHRVYQKKKEVTIRDMALSTADDGLREDPGSNDHIPIE